MNSSGQTEQIIIKLAENETSVLSGGTIDRSKVYLKLIKKSQKITIRKQLDLATLVSSPITSKIFCRYYL